VKKALVTGASGFIGSNLVDRLLLEGYHVIGVDNFSTGQQRFLEGALKSRNFEFHQLDLLKAEALDPLLGTDVERVFHLAANADVREGLLYPQRDLEQNILVTSNVLESMRRKGTNAIAFSSTGSVYGEAAVIPTPEDCPFPIQTSLYAASKIAAEGFLSAYAEGFGFKAHIFRFVSILGERYTHGHVFDFIKKLQKDPSEIHVLGNGRQRKSYLYIGDCLDAILTAVRTETRRPVEIYNLGTDEYVEVNNSLDIICRKLGVSPKRTYAGGERGWVGDNPFIFLDCTKIKSTGWKAKKSIAEAVGATVDYLLENRWLFEARS
jgi:UDP-glucose 4-epimerase